MFGKGNGSPSRAARAFASLSRIARSSCWVSFTARDLRYQYAVRPTTPPVCSFLKRPHLLKEAVDLDHRGHVTPRQFEDARACEGCSEGGGDCGVVGVRAFAFDEHDGPRKATQTGNVVAVAEDRDHRAQGISVFGPDRPAGMLFGRVTRPKGIGHERRQLVLADAVRPALRSFFGLTD